MPRVADLRTEELAEMLRETLGDEREHVQAVVDRFEALMRDTASTAGAAVAVLQRATDDAVAQVRLIIESDLQHRATGADITLAEKAVERGTGIPADTAYMVVLIGRLFEHFLRATSRGEDRTPIDIEDLVLIEGAHRIPGTDRNVMSVEARAAVSPQGNADPEELLGPAPSPERMKEVHASEQRLHREQLEQALAGALTRQEAADRLGVTAQAVSTRRRQGAMTGISRGSRVYFPAWQFWDDGTLPGLAEVINAWPGSRLALTLWAMTPAVDLDGQTPAQAMAARRTADVLELERGLEVAGW